MFSTSSKTPFIAALSSKSNVSTPTPSEKSLANKVSQTVNTDQPVTLLGEMKVLQDASVVNDQKMADPDGLSSGASAEKKLASLTFD
ncbi:hypothetical protein KUCAC02_022017 [Chaenocephalus aceratus]|nr:hypothetical protein KUCAC02_022006 [Chaenocephalus aceratus]KAI4798502.1 hypothetical protein KUCAC02_022017 [Chaenocephalus aceratus]